MFTADDPLVSRVIPGKWGYPTRNGAKVLWVVMHTAETPELQDTDVNVARYFAGLPATRVVNGKKVSAKASAHYIVGDEIIQGWPEAGTAFAAPGANAEGIQIELCGRARQNPEQWRDDFSTKQLQLASKLVASICRRHHLEMAYRGPMSLRQRLTGVTGHVLVNQAFHRSTHSDPGPSFPWSRFMTMVKAAR